MCVHSGLTISSNTHKGSTVYVDGMALTFMEDSTAIWNFTLPSRALEVVAVHILSDSDHQGFMILITDQLYTDAGWRCSFNNEHGDWMGVGFNDSHWEKADVINESVIFTPAKSIYPSHEGSQGEDYFCRGSCKLSYIINAI